MPYLIVRHKVADYDKWKTVFDADSARRKASGSQGGRLFRNTNNPNETFIMFQWDTLERAAEFAQSDDLRQVVQRAGIVDQPDVYFLEEVETVDK